MTLRRDRTVAAIVEVVKHLQGKHDQKDHSSRQGQSVTEESFAKDKLKVLSIIDNEIAVAKDKAGQPGVPTVSRLKRLKRAFESNNVESAFESIYRASGFGDSILSGLPMSYKMTDAYKKRWRK